MQLNYDVVTSAEDGSKYVRIQYVEGGVLVSILLGPEDAKAHAKVVTKIAKAAEKEIALSPLLSSPPSVI